MWILPPPPPPPQGVWGPRGFGGILIIAIVYCKPSLPPLLQESLELQNRQTRPVAVTSLSFPSNDVNKFLVGSEECVVYQGQRHGSKPGVAVQFEGHDGPITAVSSHRASGGQVCLSVCMYIYILCMYVCVHECRYVCIYVCTCTLHVCMCLCVCTCMYDMCKIKNTSMYLYS